MAAEVQTQTGRCATHGTVQATREIPKMGFPFIVYGPRSPEVSDDQGHDLRERDRGLCGNLLNHRTLYR
jgi:hypothetical protein